MEKLNKHVITILFISVVSFLTNAAKAQEAVLPGGALVNENVEYKSEGLRDPFEAEPIGIKSQPQEAAELKPLPATVPLKVQGIVWGSSMHQAIINNKVVRVGDTIEGVQITEIVKKGIIVLFEDQKYIISSSSANLQVPKQSQTGQGPKQRPPRR